jgi:hypothetical protein
MEMVERWPAIFEWPPRPLAVGLGPVILSALATTPPWVPPWTTMTYQTLEQAVGTALEAWCSSPLYLAKTRAGAPRIALDGAPLGKVLKAEEAWARNRFKVQLFECFPLGGPPEQLRAWALSLPITLH